MRKISDFRMDDSEFQSAYNEACKAGVVEIIAGRRSVEEIRRRLNDLAERHEIPMGSHDGMEPGCIRRDQLELIVPVRCIQGCGRWIRSLRKGARLAYPMQELVFISGEEIHGEEVRRRWDEIGSGCSTITCGKRMIAPKDSPIWSLFGDFGRPWMPFFKTEFGGPNQLMLLVKPVGFTAALQIGWKRGMLVEPPPSEVDWSFADPTILAERWKMDAGFSLCLGLPPVVFSLDELDFK